MDRWTAADFLARAQELKWRLSFWPTDDPPTGLVITTFIKAEEYKQRTLRDSLASLQHGPRPDKPLRFYHEERRAVPQVERPTDRGLTLWLLSDFWEHVRAEGDASEPLKHVRLVFERLIDQQAYRVRDAADEVERQFVESRIAENPDDPACYIITGRPIPQTIVDDLVAAADRLMNQRGAVGIAKAPPEAMPADTCSVSKKIASLYSLADATAGACADALRLLDTFVRAREQWHKEKKLTRVSGAIYGDLRAALRRAFDRAAQADGMLVDVLSFALSLKHSAVTFGDMSAELYATITLSLPKYWLWWLRSWADKDGPGERPTFPARGRYGDWRSRSRSADEAEAIARWHTRRGEDRADLDVLLSDNLELAQRSIAQATQLDELARLRREERDELIAAASMASPGGQPVNGEHDAREAIGKKTKRSTVRGEARDKLIAALTAHHRYEDGSCLETRVIGVNELARIAEVSPSTAKVFFDREFNRGEKGGHARYRALCQTPGRLAISLRALRGEIAPHLLYGRRPTSEAKRDEE